MKKVKLKLTQLNKVELEEKQMNSLKGGGCGCSCYWASNPGGASTHANLNDNHENGYHSEHGCNQYGTIDDCCIAYECIGCDEDCPGIW
jgi:natural product precursor